MTRYLEHGPRQHQQGFNQNVIELLLDHGTATGCRGLQWERKTPNDHSSRFWRFSGAGNRDPLYLWCLTAWETRAELGNKFEIVAWDIWREQRNLNMSHIMLYSSKTGSRLI